MQRRRRRRGKRTLQEGRAGGSSRHRGRRRSKEVVLAVIELMGEVVLVVVVVRRRGSSSSGSSSSSILTRGQREMMLLAVLVALEVVGISRRGSGGSNRTTPASTSSTASTRSTTESRGKPGHRMIDRAKRPDTVEEIRPRIVDGHGRVVRILSPTLGRRRAQVIPDLPWLVPLAHPDMLCSAHRLKLGPLVWTRPIAKRIACHGQRRVQFLPAPGFAHQVRGQWFGSWYQGCEVALPDHQHPTVRQFDDITAIGTNMRSVNKFF